MKPQYEPKTWEQKLGYLVEEAGEVLAAAGKTLRWGPLSVNPELPPEKQETNVAWLLREMADLEGAIQRVRNVAASGWLMSQVTSPSASPVSAAPTTAGFFTTATGPTCQTCGSLLIPQPVGSATELRCVNGCPAAPPEGSR